MGIVRSLLMMACVLCLCACGNQEESSKPASNNVKWEENTSYAVGFLGYGDEAKEKVAVALERYLPDSSVDSIQRVETEGDEWYLIIPREATTEVNVFELEFETEPKRGDKIAELEKGKPFILRCNVSDIMPNQVIEFKNGSKELSYSPSISLMDGSVAVGEYGQALELE